MNVWITRTVTFLLLFLLFLVFSKVSSIQTHPKFNGVFDIYIYIYIKKLHNKLPERLEKSVLLPASIKFQCEDMFVWRDFRDDEKLRREK